MRRQMRNQVFPAQFRAAAKFSAVEKHDRISPTGLEIVSPDTIHFDKAAAMDSLDSGHFHMNFIGSFALHWRDGDLEIIQAVNVRVQVIAPCDRPNPFRGTGINEITGFQSDIFRQPEHNVRGAPDELGERAALPYLTIDGQPDRTLRRNAPAS